MRINRTLCFGASKDFTLGVTFLGNDLESWAIAVALTLGLHWLRRFVSRVAIATNILQLAIWGDTLLRLARPPPRQRRQPRTSSRTIVCFLLRLALWVIAFLMVLDNFGFNITALVASPGIGGIAVALAVQNRLGDLLASLSILLDKPIEIGDFITVGEVLGSVEHIGLKTTRLRTVQHGENRRGAWLRSALRAACCGRWKRMPK